jgi:hypothetical protein
MNEAQLRALVRDAVARHLGRTAPIASGPSASAAPDPATGPATGPHNSQALYLTVINSGDACFIESAVVCDHCGYCKTHGF